MILIDILANNRTPDGNEQEETKKWVGAFLPSFKIRTGLLILLHHGTVSSPLRPLRYSDDRINVALL